MRKDKVTTTTFREMMESGEPITMLTAYDYPLAQIVDQSGIDAILVGDSVSNVVLGHENTLAVTMDEMIYHAKSVTRATERPLVIGHMPFLSFQTNSEDAVRNAGRFVKEAGTGAVKVEGGREIVDRVEAIVRAGIPVMGHLGFTPQWLLKFGGYKVRGRLGEEARVILEDAKKLEESGVFSIVLEMVPRQLAKLITEEVDVPTIGIGAGQNCDGQVLVLHDLLGLSGFSPKFAKQYTDLKATIGDVLEKFRDEVKSGKFPTHDHAFEMEKKDLDDLKERLNES